MGQKPWVNYHHLLYFKTIALEGGIAKAAKKLRLGQPTLSTQLKQFEEALGHQLFDRSKRHLQLTDAGRLVLGYASEIFKMGDEMVDSLNDHHVASKLQVQIGVADTVPKHLTHQVFRKAQESYDCVVSISSGHNDELMRELRAHRVDLVVANYPPAVGEAAGFFAKCIAKMPVGVCGAKKFAHLKRDFPDSLKDQPFVMPAGQTKLRQDVEHYLKLRNLHVNVIAEVQDTGVQKLLASHGDGLVPLAFPAAKELIESKSLVLIGTLQDLSEELWLVAAQRRIQNPVAAAIMNDLKI
jgi:LysR family transcriptional activator of nhaA